MLAEVVGATAGWLAVHLAAPDCPGARGSAVPRAATSELAHIAHALLAMFRLHQRRPAAGPRHAAPDQAGTTAAARIVLRSPSGCRRRRRGGLPRLAGGRSRALVLGCAVVAGLGLLVTAGVAVLGPWLLPTLLRPSYAGLSTDAPLFALAARRRPSPAAVSAVSPRQDRWAAVAVGAVVVALVVLVVTVAHASPRSSCSPCSASRWCCAPRVPGRTATTAREPHGAVDREERSTAQSSRRRVGGWWSAPRPAVGPRAGV